MSSAHPFSLEEVKMQGVLHLGLSYNCNMKCEHCYVNRGNSVLTTQQIKNMLDVLTEKGLMFVYYTFGEPLLASNLFDIAEYAKSKNLIQVLMTNGYLISDDVIKKITSVGITNVYVSIDSMDEKFHDKNRGVDGALEAACLAIRRLKEHGVNVGISTAITEQNVSQMNAIYNFAIKEDIKIISFLRTRRDNGIAQLSDEFENYINFFKFAISQKKINIKFHDPEVLPFLREWHEKMLIPDIIYEKYYCMSGCHSNSTISIAPNGDVGNCNLAWKKVGNIYETKFEEILKRLEKNENPVCCTSLSE